MSILFKFNFHYFVSTIHDFLNERIDFVSDGCNEKLLLIVYVVAGGWMKSFPMRLG